MTGFRDTSERCVSQLPLRSDSLLWAIGAAYTPRRAPSGLEMTWSGAGLLPGGSGRAGIGPLSGPRVSRWDARDGAAVFRPPPTQTMLVSLPRLIF